MKRCKAECCSGEMQQANYALTTYPPTSVFICDKCGCREQVRSEPRGYVQIDASAAPEKRYPSKGDW